MIITRYKPLFSFAASYELADASVTSDGMLVAAPLYSLDTMTNFKLKPQFKDNTVTVFFEGKETPSDAPVTSQPFIIIDTNEYFYFNINLLDKDIIKDLKFHSTDAIAKEIGFPVLYNASISVLDGPANVFAQEDVRIINSVFTFFVTKAQSGLTADYATLEIRDEENILIDLNIPTAPTSIDEVSGNPGFSFSTDASSLIPGIYNFKVGNYEKKFFITGDTDILSSVSLVRVLKNSFLEYKTNLADSSLAAFELTIPKA